MAALLEVQKRSEDLHKQNVGTDENFNSFSGIMEANVAVVSQDSKSCGYVSSACLSHQVPGHDETSTVN